MALTESTRQHVLSILDWEIHALYSKLKQTEGKDAALKKSIEKLQIIFSAAHDTRLFLGNLRLHPTSFLIVGLWYPKKLPPNPQQRLF